MVESVLREQCKFCDKSAAPFIALQVQRQQEEGKYSTVRYDDDT